MSTRIHQKCPRKYPLYVHKKSATPDFGGTRSVTLSFKRPFLSPPPKIFGPSNGSVYVAYLVLIWIFASSTLVVIYDRQKLSCPYGIGRMESFNWSFRFCSVLCWFWWPLAICLPRFLPSEYVENNNIKEKPWPRAKIFRILLNILKTLFFKWYIIR